MKPDTGCEDVRLRLMAAIDGEIDAASGADREHVSACTPCREWLSDLQQMDGRLQRLPYPQSRIDLWASLETRIREIDSKQTATGRFWIIGALVLAWRALQLLVDLPLPALHPIVPFAVVAVTLWLLAKDALTVKTFAPELQKRGI